MGSGFGEAFMVLMYVGAFAVALVLALIVGLVLSIFWPIPVWALLSACGVFAVLASIVTIRALG